MPWLKPAEGRRVFYEGGGPMPPEGDDVPDTSYYRRLVREGGLVKGRPPRAEAAGKERDK